MGIKIVKHVHSGAREPDGDDGYHVPVTPPPSTTQLEHPPTPEDMAHLVEHAPDAEAGTVLYRFQVGDLSSASGFGATPPTCASSPYAAVAVASAST